METMSIPITWDCSYRASRRINSYSHDQGESYPRLLLNDQKLYLRFHKRDSFLEKIRNNPRVDDLSTLPETAQKIITHISSLVSDLYSGELSKQSAAIEHLVQLLCDNSFDPPVQTLLNSGILRPLILLLESSSRCNQIRVLDILSNIVEYHEENTEKIMKENGHKHILSLLRSPDLELREHALYCLANILFDVDSHDPRLVDCGLWDAICWILTGNLPVKSIQSPLIAMPSFPPCRSGTLLVRENVNVTVGEAFLSQGKMFVDAGRLMQAVASHNTKLPLSSEELEIIIPRIFALFTSNQPTVVNCALITLKHLSGSSEGALMISREGYIPHLIYYLEFGLKPTSSQDESRIRKALALHSAYVLTNVSAISEELSHTLSDSGILPCLKSMLARSSLSSAFVELSSRIAYNLILESVESRNKILERKLHLDVLKALRELSEKTASSSSPRNSADDKSTFQEAFLFLSLIVSNRCDAALELVEHKIGELIFTTLHNQTDAYCQFFSLTLVHSILKAAGTGGILGEFECEKGQKDLSRKDEDERREKEGFSESDIFAEMIEKPQKLENDKSLFHQEEEKLADESSQSGSSSEQLMIVKNHLQSTLAIAEVELLCESKQPLISSKASDILNEYFGTKAGSLMSVEGV